MSIVRCPFNFDRDLDRVREFLLEVYNSAGALHYLVPTKIENQKYGPCGNDYSPKDDEAIKIWKQSGKDRADIVAVSHRGSSANYHIEIHPDYKDLERELFLEIEKLESSISPEPNARMYMYTVGPDSERASILTDMGYEDYGLHEYNYRGPHDKPTPRNPPPDGFTLRGLEGEEDYPDFIKVVGSVYDHCRQYMTLQKMKFMTQAEFYHRDLNLVMINHDGSFVGFCMYRLDPLTRIAEMEALGVHPDFEGWGLESALLTEGLRRLMTYQPNFVCAVEIDVSEQLNQFLESAGFVRSVTMNQWGRLIN
ncbi:MAG: GNAT family N-acetyltransferase [Candidatus Thorarchaeota archaeon]|nr:GNAT family N-acetyltransferase [Candidatus Thorarchaeota archaeon]